MKRKPEKSDGHSNYKFYVETILHIYRDCATSCCLSASQQDKDCKTLTLRAYNEGMSFLTKTLPSLGKCLDKALSRDIPFPNDHSFQIGRDGYPCFLQGFWKLIFRKESEVDPVNESHQFVDWRAATHDYLNREVMSVEAVRAVRQICFLFYKLEGSHSEESEHRMLREFYRTDISLPDPDDKRVIKGESARALENARLLIHYAFKYDSATKTPDLDLEDILPKHGPGSVATGEKPWEKMKFSRFYEKLDSEYSYPDYFYFNYSHLAECLEDLEALESHDSAIAKMVMVPKDSRGPRLISMEPLELQWIQQGQMRAMVKHLESHSLTRGFVNFTSQEINRRLALEHSCSGGYMATMDMKEASDRVSVWLVKQLFPQHIWKKLLAARSDYTQLPDGTLLKLNKFAPMGSATCFPVEAVVFWALAVGTLVDIRCARDINNLPSVYVYGDDIILPKEYVEKVGSVYEDYYLLVNTDKCCDGRFFRESCGMDAYKQCSVTPVRHRKHPNFMSPPALLAYVAYCNMHQARGHLSTAKYLRGQIISGFGQLPVSNVEGKYPLSFVDTSLTNHEVCEYNSKLFRHRENKALQRMELRLKMPHAPSIKKGEPDWHELQRKGALGLSDPFGFRASQFEPCWYTVPQRTSLKWAWVDISQLAGK